MLEQKKRCYDLPLLVNPQNNHHCSKKTTDLPRQLKNDIYRPANKENIDQPPALKQKELFLNSVKKTSKTPCKAPKEDSNKKGEKTLKELIKKKLSINEGTKAGKPYAKKSIELKTIEVQHDSKYHQLLQQFYGGPSLPKKQKEPTTRNRQCTQLTRHQSAKTIKNPALGSLPKPGLQKVRSFSSIKSPKQSAGYPSKNPTYLDLYLQKRKPVLFL